MLKRATQAMDFKLSRCEPKLAMGTVWCAQEGRHIVCRQCLLLDSGSQSCLPCLIYYKPLVWFIFAKL